ncbi:MAG: M36 family metallopeptidase, partial [Phycisphaerales bacterium]|nr:M36 family metallopeptidase [Phycisphaerales bacterium]
LGTPTFIRSTTAFLSRRSTAAPLDIAAAFVNDNPALFGVPFPAANDYRSLRNYVTPSLGVRHITLQQRHGGQDVFGSLLTANITTDGMLVNIGSSFLPMPAGLTGAPACGARNAIASACDAMDDDRLEDLLALVPEATECTTDWASGQSVGVGTAVGGMFVQAVLYPVSATEIVQAWDVRLPYRDADGGTQWQCIVAHSDGALLMSRNLVTHFCQPDPVTFRVFPGDSPVPGTPGLAAPVPNGSTVCGQDTATDSECVMRCLNGQAPCAQDLGDGRVLMTVAPNQYSSWGWINDGQFEHCADFNGGAVVQTCGNNAAVRTNAGIPVLGSDFPNRDFAPGLDWMNVESKRTAAVVHAFAVVNEWHDRMMALGFDEVAGNFQQVNSQIGGVTQGLGGDALEIIVDGTPGSSGTVSPLSSGQTEDGHAFRVRYGDSTRIPAFDNTVLYHELGHALSLRLHANYYFGHTESNGLSEGWSDYLAVALTHEPGDSPTASYPVFAWASRPVTGAVFNHYFFGTRIYPYSPSMAINPLKYKYIDSGSTATAFPEQVPRNPAYTVPVRTELHFVGTVWAMMLVECRAELAEDIGADDANQVLLQLVIDGMKLDPGSPKFVDARDAILQADLIRFGGVHQAALWRGFAQRGLGLLARPSAQPTGTNNITASEAVPPSTAVSFFFPDDVPPTIETCRPTDIEVLVVAPTGMLSLVTADARPNPQALGLFGGPLMQVGPGRYQIRLSPAPCRDSWTIWVKATAAGQTVPSPQHRVTAGLAQVVFEDDMDPEPVVLPGNNKWVASPLPPDTGAWEAMNPNGSQTTPARDATPGAGQVCWVTEDKDWSAPTPSVLDNDVDPGDGVALSTPEFELPPGETAIIEYWLWYFDRNPLATANQPGAEEVECVVEWLRGGEVRASWAMTPESAALRWQRHRLTVGTSDGSGPARIRFRFQDLGLDSVVEGGIDDVIVRCTTACEECCDADVNIDGNVDQDDVVYLIQVVGGGPNSSGIDPDWNKDGNVDQDDVQALINYVSEGAGCP